MPDRRPHHISVFAWRAWLRHLHSRWGKRLAAAVLAFMALAILLNGFEGWQLALKQSLIMLGTPGFLLFTVLYNVVLVPFPYDPFLMAWAAWGQSGVDVIQSAGVATLGMLLAALLDYAGGFWLRPRVEPWLRKQRGFTKAERALHDWGVWAVALSAVTPIPFSLVCWLAGMVRVNVGALLVAVAITRMVRNVLVVWFLSGF